MNENVRHLLTAFADEVLEWNLESSWGSGASTTFESIVERYTYEMQTLTTCDDGCSVPVSSLLKLLLLIDPAPVVVTENEVMVFKNPKAADVLTQISAEVRSLIASAQKQQQTSSLGDELGVVRTDSDFDFDRNSQTHTPKLTLYFEPVQVQAPYNSKGWNDRDTAAALLAAPERKID